jgi:transposase
VRLRAPPAPGGSRRAKLSHHPIALNGQRKTDKLDARALCLRLSRWLDGNRDELSPIRIPTEAEQRRRETTRRRQFLAREIRCLANRGHGQVAEYGHITLPHRWWGPRAAAKVVAPGTA